MVATRSWVGHRCAVSGFRKFCDSKCEPDSLKLAFKRAYSINIVPTRLTYWDCVMGIYFAWMRVVVVVVVDRRRLLTARENATGRGDRRSTIDDRRGRGRGRVRTRIRLATTTRDDDSRRRRWDFDFDFGVVWIGTTRRRSFARERRRRRRRVTRDA